MLTSQFSLGIRHGGSEGQELDLQRCARVSGEGLAEYPLEDMPASKLWEKKSTTHVRFLITCLFSQQRSAIKVNHVYYITQSLPF